MEVEDLPDFPALKQLGRALWRDGATRGAAVFVGAGFSRNAELSGADTPKPPLWDDLAASMRELLYLERPHEAPKDPLRLAEEFRTYFGQEALDDFIRHVIRDNSWRPSDLHKRLLELPWSDVLTTNWDTLLEQSAALTDSFYYEPVRNLADLASARAPRIVKLHGSIGTTAHFVVAEEDYRTYPTQFAAFVNLARQIFVENELCLVGFSGDDPNFLQWSGWVRDHLAGSARRIYLVGDLELGGAKRKLLEARNVAPIDFGPLLLTLNIEKSERQRTAARLFLDYLSKAKPRRFDDWQPAIPQFQTETLGDLTKRYTDAAIGAAELERSSDIWRKDRLSYPGWLVCPGPQRDRLRTGTDVILLRKSVFEAIPEERRPNTLYELAWRYRTALMPLTPALVEQFTNVADPSKQCCLDRSQQLEIATSLLKAARREKNLDAFSHWSKVISENAAPDSDFAAEVEYQRCLIARDQLNLVGIAENVQAIKGTDPIWLLRRASLHNDVGEHDQARQLIDRAVNELRDRQRGDRRSLWIHSRRAWARWLSRTSRLSSLDVVPSEDSSKEVNFPGCDPWEEISQLKDKASEALRKLREEQTDRIPRFSPGSYKDPADTIRFRNEANAWDELSLMAETIGVPFYIPLVSLLGGIAKDILDATHEPTTEWYSHFIHAISSHSDSLVEKYFGRVAVAKMPASVLSDMYERAEAGITYWSNFQSKDSQRSDGWDRLRLFIEVTARIAVRLPPKKSMGSFRRGIEIAHNDKLSHYWLNDPLDHLLEYSISAIPPAERSTIISDLIKLPLSTEKGLPQQMGWPNPINLMWEAQCQRPSEDAKWNFRISELLQAAGVDNAGRSEAITRLACLASWGYLTDDQLMSLGKALWSLTEVGSPSLPRNAGVYAFIFARIPGPLGIDSQALVRSWLFDSPHEAHDEPWLYALLGGANAKSNPRILPTPEQATKIFDRIVEWRRPDNVHPIEIALGKRYLKSAPSLMGQVLARVAIPNMLVTDFTDTRSSKLFAFIDEASVGSALAGLPFLYGISTDIATEIIRRIRRGIIGETEQYVWGSTIALLVWDNAQNGTIVPEELVRHLISAIETRREIGLPQHIYCGHKLIQIGRISAELRARLSEALGDLFVETDYENIQLESRRAISVSIVRAEAVRLAKALKDAGTDGPYIQKWLDAYAFDPLPEVRFALQQQD